MSNLTQQRPDILVTDWIDQFAPQQHAVFRTNGFNSQRARAPQLQQQRAGALTDDFCNIVQQFEDILPSHARGGRIDIRASHSWDEVVRAAKEAETAYLAETRKGSKGAVRGYLRRFGDYSATATPWTGLLPNDKYFSVLCGGLKIVLGIAARRSERRIEIFEAFELLPATIEKTQRCHEVFPKNLELRDKALTVYLDILTMVEAMIACLLDKKLLARIKDGLRGPLADEDLDEKKRRFHKSMDALEQQVHFLHLSSSAKANRTIAEMSPRVHNTERMVSSIDSTAKVLHHTSKIALMEFEELRSDVASHSQMTHSLAKQVEMQTQAIELQSQSRDNLASLLQDHISNIEWRTAELQRAINRRFVHEGSQLQLISHLSHALEHVSQDLGFAVQSTQLCSPQSQSAMYWVLQSPRFKHWLQGPLPDVLGVSGRLEDGMARYSSTSLLCGMLVQSLQESNVAHVLQFFCGPHNSRFDAFSGPKALIQSLLAQLLSLQQFDISFLRFGQWEEGLKANNISTYCSLFRRLIEQLPTSMLFCIIDSVSVFEVENWADDLQIVLRTILETVADPQLSVRLKLLITSASRSRCMDSLLNENDALDVPTDTGDPRVLNARSVYSELADGPYSTIYGTADHTNSSYENFYDTGYE